jgi:hypothetical protein
MGESPWRFPHVVPIVASRDVVSLKSPKTAMMTWLTDSAYGGSPPWKGAIRPGTRHGHR